MHLTSLRVPFLVSTSMAALVLPAMSAAAQNTAKQGTASPAPAGKPAPKTTASDLDLTGLPPFLLPVPGGAVEMGLDAGQLINAACQATWPEKPESAAKIAADALKKALGRSASVLGHKRVEVPTYLLAKFPVTNGQYVKFVDARRKAGVKMRAPFHWWQVGCKDDYESKLEDIAKSFPKQEHAAEQYWERNGGELPYKLLDAKGNPIDDQPVVFVTWRDANEFAASIGMRLPTEAEWTRAARADSKQLWPLLKPEQAFTAALFQQLRMSASADKKAKPVGTTADAAGPFGHMDMFGQVWQFVGDVGYRPINGSDAFAAEWKALQKDKTGQLLSGPPAWKDDKIVTKGGSWLSANEPIQLLIDARAPMQTADYFESQGFRLAKSLKPGYDALYSVLRGTFSRTAFQPDQEVDLANQIGAERYELDDKGFPTSFETVTFAPMTWLGRDKNADFPKLVDKSEWTPMLIGVLMTTNKMSAPACDGGIFSVLWRHAGVPKELTDAVKQGAKDLAAAAKMKDEKAEENKKASWREVIAKFGLTEKDLESKEAAEGRVPFVRVDGFDVPTDSDQFVLLSQDGKPVVAWKAGAKPTLANATGATLALGAGADKKMTATFKVGVPVNPSNAKRVADFTLEIALDRDPPAADKPWRLPATK